MSFLEFNFARISRMFGIIFFFFAFFELQINIQLALVDVAFASTCMLMRELVIVYFVVKYKHHIRLATKEELPEIMRGWHLLSERAVDGFEQEVYLFLRRYAWHLLQKRD